MNRFGKTFCIIFTLVFFTQSLFASALTNKVSDEKKENKLKIFADSANYNKKEKVAVVTGNVKIIQDNTTIFTWTAIYNEEQRITNIDNFVRIIHHDKESKRKTDISSNKMVVYHAEKKVHLENDVRFDREEDRKIKKINNNKNKSNRQKMEESIRKERTIINADIADYWTKTGDAIFTGKALLLQKEKKAQGDTILVKNDSNKNTDLIVLDKNASVIQIRGDWLQKEGVIDPKDDEEKERIVKERIEMFGDKITIFPKTNDMICEKNVRVKQKAGNKFREAIGDKSIYRDTDKTITLIGNVKIKRETDEWLKSEKAVFHTDSENFEAYGTADAKKQNNNTVKQNGKKQVESEFFLPDEEASPTPKPVVTPEPEFNLDEKSTKKAMPTAPPAPKSPIPSQTPFQVPKPNI